MKRTIDNVLAIVTMLLAFVPCRISAQNSVGSPKGAFTVSPSGAATYSVSIDMPEPANGLKPDISITYNSQAGNGIVGYGCNISGISAITRGAKDIYHDGQANRIQNTNNDAFFLDGKRIITGHPEGDPYTTVTKHDEGGYSWFEVAMPDGKTYQYGKGTDSRFTYMMHDGSSCIAAWYISKITDRLGNTITYSYNLYNNVVAPYQITYNTNAYDSSYKTYRILFQYETRDDALNSYVGSTLCSLDRRVKRITTRKGNTVYRSYDFEYSTDDESGKKYSRLASVTEKNSNGESLNPVTLQWDDLPDYSQSVYNSFYHSDVIINSLGLVNLHFYGADINGDGITDIVVDGDTIVSRGIAVDSVLAESPQMHGYSSDSIYMEDHANSGHLLNDSLNDTLLVGSATVRSSSVKKNRRVYALLSNLDEYGIGHENLRRMWLTHYVSNDPVDSIDASPVVGNFFGQGHCSIGIPRLYYNDRDTNQFYVDVFDKDGENAVVQYDMGSSRIFPLTATADMDNDGRSEIIMLKREGGTNFYYGCFVSFNDNGTTTNHDFYVVLPHDPIALFTNDYNNDGMQDFMVFYEGGYRIFWGRGISGTALVYYQTDGFTEYALEGKPNVIREGDFNGDGCPDYLLSYYNDFNWYIAYGEGNGGLRKKNVGYFVYMANVTKTQRRFGVHVLDFDGDGMSDIVFSRGQFDYSGNKAITQWIRSTGDSLVTVKNNVTSLKVDDALNCRYMVGDFNGDGHADLMNYGYDCYNSTNANVTPTLHRYQNTYLNPSSGKLTSITDGFGRETDICYNSLTLNPPLETDDEVSYPMANVVVPLHVVSQVSAGNGIAGTSTQTYEYGGLKVHLQGKGLLGFSTTSVADENSGAVTTSSVDGWNTTFYVPAYTTTTKEVGGHTSTEEVTVGFAGSYNNKLAYPAEVVTEDFEGNTTRTVMTYSDYYGKPTSETVYYGSSTVMFKKTEYQSYSNVGGVFLPQTIIRSQKHANDSNMFSLTTRYTYNSQGLPTQVIENYGITGKTVTSDYTYDSCGRKLTECTTGTGYPGITYSYEYTNGRLTSVTDDTTPVRTDYSYNDWGDLTAEVDLTVTSSPLVKSYTYDSWNRLTSTTDPTGIVATTTWGWGNTQAKKYYVEEESDSLSWSKTWYDSCGREVETESCGPLGVTVSSHTEYDDKGQVTRTTSTVGDLTTWEEHEYDDLGRIVETTTSSGSLSTFSYEGRTATECRNGKTYGKTVDAWGNTVTATDPVSSVSYSYFSNGKPATATSEGSTVTMAYDAVGNQTSLTDPDAGTMTYTYDAAGHVVTQTDARGKVTENEYDSWGRLSKTTIDGEETTCTYGTTGRERLWLKREQVGGNSIDYTHDQYGRVIGETRTVDSTAVLNFAYRYNGKGLVDQVTYPEGIIVNYAYDQYGNRKEMSINNIQTWQLTNYAGKTTQAQVGSDLTTYSVLDDNGLMASVGVRRNQNLLHSMSFTHEGATGNLLERTGMFAYDEAFTYDDLDRLTSYTAQNGTKNITYADNGNILSHTDRGSFLYNSTRPHAVIQVGSATNPVFSQAYQNVYTYNGYGKVSHIHSGKMLSAINNYDLDVYYGPDRERWKSVETGMFPSGGGGITPHAIAPIGSSTRTNLYAGDYERIDGTSYYYLDGGVIYVKPATGAGQAYYALTDHLGSYTRLYTMAGDSVLIASYDPWGNRTTTKNTLKFHRGFTGHEHLTTYGVINMNGRMYDPTVGRFLAPDNFVQMPDFSQSFNRYSYCLNNPLKYTDPSGELFGIDDAFLIFALASSTISGMAHASMQGKNIWLGGLKGFASGALSVAGTAGIGQLLGHGVGTFGNEMLQAGLHGVNSVLISSLDGGNFFTGMATGSVSSLVGSGTQALGMSNTLVRASTAVAGSVSSGLLGGGWIEGAMQGYNIGTFNHTWKYLGNGLYECTLDEIVVTATRRSFMGAVHAGLDAAGLILDVADLLNSGLYLAEGDYVNAGLSAAAMVPVIGSFATSGKYANKAYHSFNAFKRAYGNAGAGKAWHHIVEQTPSNLKRFGPERIHSPENLIKLPHGKGSIHNKISGFYSSKQLFSGQMTVRKWLESQSFENQYRFGIEQLRKLGL